MKNRQVSFQAQALPERSLGLLKSLLVFGIRQSLERDSLQVVTLCLRFRVTG